MSIQVVIQARRLRIVFGGSRGQLRRVIQRPLTVFKPYVGARGKRYYLPTMWGAGESEVVLYPNGLASIVIGRALQLPPGETASSGAGPETAQAVERLKPFD